jgi:hypothetical protein
MRPPAVEARKRKVLVLVNAEAKLRHATSSRPIETRVATP